MRHLRFVPENTHYDFVGKRIPAFIFSIALFVVTVVSLATQGLNFGIDFRGGILIEAKSDKAVDAAALRAALEPLELGEIELQQSGNEIMIRVQQQEGGEKAQAVAIKKIQDTMGAGYEYRRTEQVGPKVGDELKFNGLLATGLAILGIALYVAFRFEWQFGIAALVATFHDVFITLGLFSVLGLDFNLTAVAALLTLAGYSINDTVVVFDRIRENLRKHKSVDLKTLINDASNQMLSRTIMTSFTVFLAILPLLVYGGSALQNFTIAMTFGIVLGTFSSVYVAASLLLYMKPVRRSTVAEEATAS